MKAAEEKRTVGAKLDGEWLEAFEELESTGMSTTSLLRQGIVRLVREVRANNGFLKSESLPPKNSTGQHKHATASA